MKTFKLKRSKGRGSSCRRQRLGQREEMMRARSASRALNCWRRRWRWIHWSTIRCKNRALRIWSTSKEEGFKAQIGQLLKVKNPETLELKVSEQQIGDQRLRNRSRFLVLLPEAETTSVPRQPWAQKSCLPAASYTKWRPNRAQAPLEMTVAKRPRKAASANPQRRKDNQSVHKHSQSVQRHNWAQQRNWKQWDRRTLISQ